MAGLATGLRAASAAFWDERIWFPPGHNWSSIQSTAEAPFPVFEDMYRAIRWGLLLCVLRAFFEWTVARPIGRYYGVSDKVVAPSLWGRLKALMNSLGLEPPNPQTLAAQKAQRDHRALKGAANGSAASNGAVANGQGDGPADPALPPRPSRPRKPAKVTTHSKLDKFSECCFRFTAYTFLWLYGMGIMWRKAWVWDGTLCWKDYPLHTLDDDVWWYYMMEAAFYWSLMFSQAFDGQYRRSDFAMNLVHHLATIGLLWLSWADNFVRVGTLVLVIHDVVDPIIEFYKMVRYAYKDFSSTDNVWGNLTLGSFIVSWFITRCGLFPFIIIRSTLFEAQNHIVFYPVYYIFNSMLLVLQALHLIWSYMILAMAYNAMAKTGSSTDVRSDDESDDDAPRDSAKAKDD